MMVGIASAVKARSKHVSCMVVGCTCNTYTSYSGL